MMAAGCGGRRPCGLGAVPGGGLGRRSQEMGGAVVGGTLAAGGRALAGDGRPWRRDRPGRRTGARAGRALGRIGPWRDHPGFPRPRWGQSHAAPRSCACRLADGRRDVLAMGVRRGFPVRARFRAWAGSRHGGTGATEERTTNPIIHRELMQARIADLHRQAERDRLAQAAARRASRARSDHGRHSGQGADRGTARRLAPPPAALGALAAVLNPGAWLFLAAVASPLFASAGQQGGTGSAGRGGGRDGGPGDRGRRGGAGRRHRRAPDRRPGQTMGPPGPRGAARWPRRVAARDRRHLTCGRVIHMPAVHRTR